MVGESRELADQMPCRRLCVVSDLVHMTAYFGLTIEETALNCFVIMPFAEEFDDVYALIKSTVEGVVAGGTQGRCFRLDESRPAGRITDRLLGELRSASICVADLTHTKPNVMWELGFAMALGKPAILLTQSRQSLPFDIRDMQSIEYSRNRLNATLQSPLRQSLLDTLGAMATVPSQEDPRDIALGALLTEVSELKGMVGDIVRTWKGNEPKDPQSPAELQALAGHWFNTESHSSVYLRQVRGELVAPYCFGGDDHLTGVYYGWQRTGEFWFARYIWLDADLSGFSFLRMESVDRMRGAWWSSEYEKASPDTPPRSAGVPANWIRQSRGNAPLWAEDFFQKVQREGLASILTNHSESAQPTRNRPKRRR